jgi:uroporphyrinogen decarboxylase
MKQLSHRQRVLDVLNHQEPDRVPFDCTFTIGAYRRLIAYLSLPFEEPLRPNQWQELRPSPAVVEALDLDICYLDLGRPSGAPIFTQGMDVFVDEWGLKYRRIEHAGAGQYYELFDPPLANATESDLDDYPWPDPADPGWVDGLAERARALCDDTDRAIVMELPVSVFETAYLMRGMEQFLVDMVLDPSFACALLDWTCAIAVGVAQAALGAAGRYVDIVKHLDDQGAQHAPLISPRMHRKMIHPRFKRLFHAIKESFAQSNPQGRLMTHTDGDIYPLIEDYIRAGIDILNPVQPNVAEMDHARLKREFGNRLAFHGGIDVQGTMPFGTPGDVAAEVRQRLRDLAPGGGYILAPSHNLQADVPPENVVALRDAVHEYGEYPIEV